MEEQTLELQMVATAQKASDGINKIIGTLTSLEGKVGNISNKIGETHNISKFVDEMNKATLSAKRLCKVDLREFESKLYSLYDTVGIFSDSMKKIDSFGIDSVTKSLRSLPNSINKINELDMRKTYGSFNSLTRVIDPFLQKIQQSEVALENFVQLSKSLETSAKSIKFIEKAMEATKNKTEEAKNKTKELDEEIKKASSSSNKLASMLKNAFTFTGVKRLTKTGLSWMNEGVDYTEQLNLFNVVFDNTEKNGKKMFSNLGKEAINFQYKMNEAFGTNKTQTLYTQAIYQSMGENQGINSYYSKIMSETMTKFTYDLASLYNKTEKTTAEALRASVYAGMTKPARGFGLDVTQTSMQPILNELGIDKQVKELSQAEKMILRYIAVLRQGQVAMGDFASTIESPSNQIKVFRQQLVETKTAISALFMGAFQKILPYANAILMVIKEVSKAIADMFGIELKDYNSGLASQEGIYDGITDSADSANKKVKELKRQVMGFDQIHNIDEPKNNGGGTGDTIGGIDKRLLDAIKGYDNGMDKVRMKATEIRDRIMEWLGFTKEIDPLTGEVFFKLKEGKTVFRTILDWLGRIWDIGKWFFNNIGTILGAFVAYKTIKIIGQIFDGISNIIKLVKTNTGLQFSIAVAVSYFLAEGISKTDFYQRLAKKLSGNALGDDGDYSLSNMWKEIFSGEKSDPGDVRGDSKKQWKELLTNRFMSEKSGIGLRPEAETAYQKLLERNKEYQDVVDYFDKKGIAGGKFTGLSGRKYNFEDYAYVKEMLNGYKDAEKEFENQKGLMEQLGGFTKLFNNFDSTPIDSYSEALQKLFNQVLTGYPNVEKYTTTIKENQQSYDEAKSSLELLIGQLGSMSTEEAIAQVDKMNGYLNTMKTSMDNVAQATYDATTSIILDLQKQGIIDDEETQKFMDNAYKRKKTQEGYNEQYINGMIELNKKLADGKISQKKYNEEVIKLNEKYNDTVSTVDVFKTKLDTLDTNVMITAKDWDNLGKSLDTTNESYKTSLEKLDTLHKNNIDFMTEQMSKCKKGSDEYKEWADLIEKENQRASDSTKKMKDSYGIYLMNITTSLIESGEAWTKEGQDTINEVNGILKEMGYDVPEANGKNYDEILKKYAEFATDMEGDSDELSSKITTLFEVMGKDSQEGFFKWLNNDLTSKLFGFENDTNEMAENVSSGIKKILELNGFKIGNKSDIDKEKMLNLGKKAKSTVTGCLAGINVDIGVNATIKNLASVGASLASVVTSIISEKADGGAFYNNSWHNIPQYANGGAPSHGTMFIGGENGPEIVGHINGRTEILNQSQMASVMYNAVVNGVAQAMSQYGGQSSEIDVHVHTDEGTVVDRVNQRTKQTGVCPIYIP